MRRYGTVTYCCEISSVDKNFRVIFYSFQSLRRKKNSHLEVHVVKCCELYLRAKLCYNVTRAFIAAYMNKPMEGSAMKYFYYRLKINLCILHEGCLISFAEILSRNLNPSDSSRLWIKDTFWLISSARSELLEESA